jgi:hypothetical protein
MEHCRGNGLRKASLVAAIDIPQVLPVALKGWEEETWCGRVKEFEQGAPSVLGGIFGFASMR